MPLPLFEFRKRIVADWDGQNKSHGYDCYYFENPQKSVPRSIHALPLLFSRNLSAHSKGTSEMHRKSTVYAPAGQQIKLSVAQFALRDRIAAIGQVTCVRSQLPTPCAIAG